MTLQQMQPVTGEAFRQPSGPVDNEVEEEDEEPMSTPPLPAVSPPPVLLHNPMGGSSSSEDDVVGRSTVHNGNLVLGDDSSDSDTSL